MIYDAPFILSDVICTGSEDSLIECDHGGYVNLTDCTGIAVALCEGKEVTIHCVKYYNHVIIMIKIYTSY